jgi:hypothetical protein
MEWNTDLDIFDMLFEARKGNNLIFLKRKKHSWLDVGVFGIIATGTFFCWSTHQSGSILHFIHIGF